MNYVKLNNGIEMPQMGYGVYQVSPQECEMQQIATLDTGRSLFFNHHDTETARMFMNWR